MFLSLIYVVLNRLKHTPAISSVAIILIAFSVKIECTAPVQTQPARSSAYHQCVDSLEEYKLSPMSFKPVENLGHADSSTGLPPQFQGLGLENCNHLMYPDNVTGSNAAWTIPLEKIEERSFIWFEYWCNATAPATPYMWPIKKSYSWDCSGTPEWKWMLAEWDVEMGHVADAHYVEFGLANSRPSDYFALCQVVMAHRFSTEPTPEEMQDKCNRTLNPEDDTTTTTTMATTTSTTTTTTTTTTIQPTDPPPETWEGYTVKAYNVPSSYEGKRTCFAAYYVQNWWDTYWNLIGSSHDVYSYDGLHDFSAVYVPTWGIDGDGSEHLVNLLVYQCSMLVFCDYKYYGGGIFTLQEMKGNETRCRTISGNSRICISNME